MGGAPTAPLESVTDCYAYVYSIQMSIHQTAASYTGRADEFHQLSDVEARQRLRSASSSSLVVRRTGGPFNHRLPSFSCRCFQ